MPMPSKREAMLKAFVVINALKRSTGVTARELSGLLGYGEHTKNNCYEAANRWIDVASLVYPVCEVDYRRYPGCTRGPMSTVYRIVK